MTVKEAIYILDPETGQSAHREITYYGGFNGTKIWGEKLDEARSMGVEALCKQEEMRKMNPCDVCSYSPPSSMGGKPCALCPATARDDEEDADEMMTITDILAAIKSCEDRIKNLQSTPRHHHGKRKHERQVYLETIKLEALSLYLESLQEG